MTVYLDTSNFNVIVINAMRELLSSNTLHFNSPHHKLYRHGYVTATVVGQPHAPLNQRMLIAVSKSI